MSKKQYRKIITDLRNILKNNYPNTPVIQRCLITAREALLSPTGSELEKFLLQKSSLDPVKTLAEDLFGIK